MFNKKKIKELVHELAILKEEYNKLKRVHNENYNSLKLLQARYDKIRHENESLRANLIERIKSFPAQSKRDHIIELLEVEENYKEEEEK